MCRGSKSYNIGDNNFYILHFPNEKEFILSSVKERFFNINDITIEVKNEMDKCDILCCNCHNKEHGDTVFFGTYKDLIYFKVDNYKEKQSKLDRNLVEEMYNSGLKQREIARRLNVNSSAINRFIQKIGGVI